MASTAGAAADDEDTDDEDDDVESLPRTDASGKPRPLEYALPEGFHCTAMCHPDTYLNKMLLGSSDGRLLLLNTNTGRNVHVFAPEVGRQSRRRGGNATMKPRAISGALASRVMSTHTLYPSSRRHSCLTRRTIDAMFMS